MKSHLTILFIFLASCQLMSQVQTIPSSARSRKAIDKWDSILNLRFAEKNLSLGSEVFFRIFKRTEELEVWVKQDSVFQLFKTYAICDYSGGLGTKKREGDRKSPEGFYQIKPAQLHPTSRFHLAFNIGYPNQLERSLGYTGSAIMIHGNCVSVGCYAMTNKYIEELWTIAVRAFENGQPSIPLHIFPFHLTDGKLNRQKNADDFNLWKDMQAGYAYFEKYKLPPVIVVDDRHYTLQP